MQNLALRHQVLDRPCYVFDRHLRIDPVLVEQIYAIGAQTLEHALDGELNVLRPAIEPRASLARLQIGK
jgi:hypothetical protein